MVSSKKYFTMRCARGADLAFYLREFSAGTSALRPITQSRLPAWPRCTNDDPYFGPYKILSVDGHRITVRCSSRLGGTVVCAAQHLKRYYDPEDLCGEEWELHDEEIAALDLQEAASPMEVEGELPDMNAEEMAKEGFYLVKSVLRHHYCQAGKGLESKRPPGSPSLRLFHLRGA